MQNILTGTTSRRRSPSKCGACRRVRAGRRGPGHARRARGVRRAWAKSRPRSSRRDAMSSTLFQATYRALGVLPRRLLYGEINHLFRIWVTGADNPDAEDNCVRRCDALASR